MKVLKFGGTSVGTPERMHSVANLINDGDEKIVVLSAVSGTTNELEDIDLQLRKGNVKIAFDRIVKLEKKYHTFIEGLLNSNTYKIEAKELIGTFFEQLKQYTRLEYSPQLEKSILAMGEIISTNLFCKYLNEKGIKAIFLPALNFMSLDENDEPDSKLIKSNLKKLLANYPDQTLFITQGYICRNYQGDIDNLKRGGSDYSASLIGAAIKAHEIQIWTDIDGMHNNDPRIVPNTYPLKELSYKEAAELAYFGAKILHPCSVLPAKESKIPIWLKNTLDPSAPGTVIKKYSKRDNIKAIAAKDNIIAIKIRSGRMLMAYGFLRKVFEIFEKYKTPIDIITTSEVSVSLSIDHPKCLNEIASELKEFSEVEIDHDLSVICVVGDFISENQGYIYRVLKALKEVPIRMVSYGGSLNNVSLVVKTDHKKKALMALNEGLFLQNQKECLTLN